MAGVGGGWQGGFLETKVLRDLQDFRVPRDSFREFPSAKAAASGTSPERVAFVEDQLFAAAIIRVQAQDEYVFRSSHIVLLMIWFHFIC